MKPLAVISQFLERERRPAVLIACAAAIALCYVFATFDGDFLLGTGPFWANPRGPWLMDPNDSVDSIDVLTTRVAYLAFLHAPWGLPLFYVPDLGAPGGSSVILVDAVPIVALLGKLLAWSTGFAINPYGLWVGACFVLSALFAVLLVMALGQRSLLAAVAATLLAVSMPALLYRFGHLSLMGQFMVIGALWLYARDAPAGEFWRRTGWWAGWLCLAALLHGYLFVMVSAVYAANWLRRVDTRHPTMLAAVGEPVSVACCVALVLLVAGHLGKGTGTSLSGAGFGYFSMNLLSPFWPQRSGLFPGFDAMQTGVDGQYEGFNYLGAGVLTMLALAVARFGRSIPAALRRHSLLIGMLIGLTMYAVSDTVFVGSHLLFRGALPHPMAAVAGIFRSSGRMFWPCGYALALFGLAFVLRRLKPGWKTAVVLSCCVLQIIDTNPLRARLTYLTERAVPTLLDLSEWEARMARAERVQVAPSFYCSAISPGAGVTKSYIVHLELQRAAMDARRPINSVNSPRLQEDCAAQIIAAQQGPWDEHTLFVFLTGGQQPDFMPGWRPPDLACGSFDRGFWCFGPADAGRE